MRVSLTLENNYTVELFIHKKISSGNFNVYHAKLESHNFECALKVFPKGNTARKNYLQEKHILSQLNHENIITYIPLQSHSLDCNLILTDYALYGNFLDLVLKGIFTQEKLIRTYFIQLIDAIGYLHSKGFAHFDIKLENCLLHKSFKLKVADFNQTQHIKDKQIIYGGTINYRAPEILTNSCKNPFAADIYSAGILLYTLKTGEFPFLEETDPGSGKLTGQDLFYLNNSLFWERKIQTKGSDYFSPGFIELINGMLMKDPAERFTLEDVTMSQWFNETSYDYKSLRVEMERIFERTFSNYAKIKSF